MTEPVGPSRRKGPPIKGLFGLVLVILYWLAVPALNARFGLSLPELRDWKPAAEKPADSPLETPLEGAEQGEVSDPVSEPVSERAEQDFLREVEPDRYVSPAGLLYTPGSQEGHRLKHVGRHLADQPQRPGSHGVFEGSLTEFLQAIDEAYTRGVAGGAGVTTEEEEGRTIYTVDLGRRIGYVGGRDGNRKERPAADSIRLVLEGKRVITAFPL